MINLTIEREIYVAGTHVWGLLEDFSDISWTGMDNVEVEGEGVGMIRRIIVGEVQAEERLDSYDAEAMTLTYTILSGNPLPVKNMQGSPKVVPIDDSRCCLQWTVTGEEQGMSVEDVENILREAYSGIMATVAGAAEKAAV